MFNVIYLILNLITLKFYLGSASNFHKRKLDHLRFLRKGSHHSQFLQRAWNKYGEDSFVFIPVYSGIDDLKEIEQRYLDFYFEHHREMIYNVSPCSSGGYIVGSLPNPELSHQKGAEKRRGKPSVFKGMKYEEIYGADRATEIIQKMKNNFGDRAGENNSFFGKVHSDEFKQRQSLRMKGVEPANKGKSVPGRPCVIDGIEYISLSQASREIGMTLRKVITRLDSPKYPNFQYLATDD